MAKIVRNKPTPEQAAGIAAFGAAADAPEPTSPAPPPPQSENGPKTSLIRWDGNEDIRDAIIAYAKRERYPIHTILLESIRKGFNPDQASN